MPLTGYIVDVEVIGVRAADALIFASTEWRDLDMMCIEQITLVIVFGKPSTCSVGRQLNGRRIGSTRARLEDGTGREDISLLRALCCSVSCQQRTKRPKSVRAAVESQWYRLTHL
jgi:hypothetical protein